jgi:hypothetical protein
MTDQSQSVVAVKYVQVEQNMVAAQFTGVAPCADPTACTVGGMIVVDAAVGGGWVFCGTELGEWGGYGLGAYLCVEGATFALLESPNSAVWSGDESIGRFSLTHDGDAQEIVVTYGTRAD